MMITKSTLKFIKSLQLKKNRIQHQCFLVEGAKSVQELLQSDFEIDLVVGTSAFFETNTSVISQINIEEIKPSDINAISSFKNNTTVVAVAKMPKETTLKLPSNNYVLALDDIRDPGNLGTIIRIADWYGIDQIIASSTTADFYNPKVISASMGSFTRVKMQQVDLHSTLKAYTGKVYGALMKGTSIHEVPFEQGGVILMGNESVGINSNLQELVSVKITIPRIGHAESLNVGIATAVICDRVRNL